MTEQASSPSATTTRSTRSSSAPPPAKLRAGYANFAVAIPPLRRVASAPAAAAARLSPRLQPRMRRTHAKVLPQRTGGLTVSEPKTARGRRIIGLPPQLLAALRQHRQSQVA